MRFRLLHLIHVSRILEKQNWLQMSQVLFRCPRINHQVVLLFKDSSEAAEASQCHAERDLATPHISLI